MDCSITVIEPGEVKKILKPRNPFAHKGSMGHALLVSGQYGMGGATILAAKACLRSGVGKLTVHTPDMNNNILQCSVPEAILSHDLSDIRVSKAISTYDYNALAIGPDWAHTKKRQKRCVLSSVTIRAKWYSTQTHSTS